jgi:hypothetical protein
MYDRAANRSTGACLIGARCLPQQTHLLMHLLAISAQGAKNDSRHILVKVPPLSS